ncbi:hypothetical protein [Paraburkholderia caledonica]|uniref:hypothetical protein n=1 Tax=Paraburkholderia caledonica TaxID=134536 RepID=UPI003CC58BD8
MLIATQHRKYSNYTPGANDSHIVGISFHKSDGTRVVNYPRQHRENLTAKNQETNEWFKHIVRIFKNGRQVMIEDGYIEAGIAPSYYIEGLLYNVPTHCFGESYANSMVRCINWLYDADRSTFLCANKQYPLLDGHTDVTWNTANCNAFLNGIIGLWKGW